VDSVAWTNKNGPLLNWGFAALIVLGILVQFLLERRRHRKSEAPSEPEPIVARPPPLPAKPVPTGWWAWSEKWLRRAG
jgi:hypothetical protein